MDAAPAPMRLDPAERLVAEIDDASHLDSGVAQVLGDLEPALVPREYDRALAGLDAEVADKAPHGPGEHHADEVVPGKGSGCSSAPAATTIRSAR